VCFPNYSLRGRVIVAGFSMRRPGFNPTAMHMRFVVEDVAEMQVFLATSLTIQFLTTLSYLIRRYKIPAFDTVS
jgi:hypothetical protein